MVPVLVVVDDTELRQAGSWRFVRQAQQDPRTRDVPIIALNQEVDQECDALLELGCAACVSKFLQTGLFLPEVGRFVNKQRDVASGC